MPNNLKFRAWDLKLKKFSFFDLSCCLPIYGDKEEFVVNQWTGLKDKNGTDIYEEDIIKWNNPDKSSQSYRDWLGLSNIDIIKYRQNSWGSELRSQHFGRDLTTEFEVIGNIFENKELLKK